METVASVSQHGIGAAVWSRTNPHARHNYHNWPTNSGDGHHTPRRANRKRSKQRQSSKPDSSVSQAAHNVRKRVFPPVGSLGGGATDRAGAPESGHRQGPHRVDTSRSTSSLEVYPYQTVQSIPFAPTARVLSVERGLGFRRPLSGEKLLTAEVIERQGVALKVWPPDPGGKAAGRLPYRPQHAEHPQRGISRSTPSSSPQPTSSGVPWAYVVRDSVGTFATS